MTSNDKQLISYRIIYLLNYYDKAIAENNIGDGWIFIHKNGNSAYYPNTWLLNDYTFNKILTFIQNKKGR